jgi:hypothetical protein
VHTWAGAILENAKLDNGRYCLLFFIQQNRKSLLSIIKLVLIVAKIITIRRISKKKCNTICHKHFKFDDFLPASQNLNTKGHQLKRPGLKKAAIPTVVWSLKTKATTAKGISEEILKNASP